MARRTRPRKRRIESAGARGLFRLRFRGLLPGFGFFFGEEAMYRSPLGFIDRGIQQILKPRDVHARGIRKIIHQSLHRI
jgi:hypothetical protein